MFVPHNTIANLWSDIRIAIENKKNNPSEFHRVYIGGLDSNIRTPVHLRKSPKISRSQSFSQDSFLLSHPFEGVMLTRREVQVLFLICHGHTNQQAADYMGLSPRTAEYYIKNMRKKIRAKSKAHLIQLVIETDFLQRTDKKILQEAKATPSCKPNIT